MAIITKDELTKYRNKGGVRNMSADNNEGAEDVNKRALPKELWEGWDVLQKMRGTPLAAIKERDYTLYAVMYKQRFGKYPQDNPKKYQVDYSVRSLYEDALLAYEIKELNKKSWDELNKANQTERLRTLDRDSYNDKYFQKFGVMPKF